jgi:S-adenosylmethionine:tRNA ribosyltransferase-isomerase
LRLNSSRSFELNDFDFVLPSELIAQRPCAQRSAARLLDGRASTPQHRIFSDLPELIQAGDLLVFNDTQVIKARLLGAKRSGGSVQALVERVLPSCEVWAHVRASKSPRTGSWIEFISADGLSRFQAQMLGRCGPDEALFHLRFPSDVLVLLERHGHVPLPPYITHTDDAQDEARYQTVFARQPGAVAAPTAALHFDQALLQALAQKGIRSAQVTLHVGAGTFQPMRTQNLSAHRMHSEWFEVPQSTVQLIAQTRAQGGKVVAVGTTTLRALESAALSGQLQACRQETSIFITPGFQFKVVDRLITNFHLPKSTLLMLVSAFAGYEHIRYLYALAIAQKYQFFSYGDAMMLEQRTI